MTFAHLGPIITMHKGKGFNIWFQDTNRTLEEKEAEIIQEKIWKLYEEYHYNRIDCRQHNKKGLELID